MEKAKATVALKKFNFCSFEGLRIFWIKWDYLVVHEDQGVGFCYQIVPIFQAIPFQLHCNPYNGINRVVL